MPRKTFSLKNILLDEVSLVDDPANPGAQVAVWKRKESGGVPAVKRERAIKGGYSMTAEELKKRLEAQETQISELTKRAETAEAATEAAEGKYDSVVKAAEESGLTVAEADGKVTVTKAKEPEYIEIDGEKVEKSLVPAPLLKQLEAQGKEIDELKKTRQMEDLRKRAEEDLPSMAGSVDERAELLKAVDAIEEDEVRDAVMKSLKAADAAVAKFADELGSGHVDETTATARLDKMAKEHAAEHDVSYEQAFDAVTKSGEGRQLAIDARNEKH